MATPTRTPPPGTTSSGTAVPLPADYAKLNTGADNSVGIRTYIDDNYQKTGRVPAGFHVENGHTVEDEPGFLYRHPWLFPVIGVTAGLTLGAVGVGAAGTGGTGATPVVQGAFNTAGEWVTGTAGGGTTVGVAGDILKSVLPAGADIVKGLIQANAQGAATEAQQKYLEEALAYEKESDLYNRTRQAGLDAQEVQRYGAYQDRIAPFITNGTNSNDRMAALLGLPPRANGSNGGSSGPSPSQRVPYDPATSAKIRAELQAVNSNDDPAAWDEYLATHGDSADKNWAYWKNRIDTGDGVGKGYAGPSVAPPVLPSTSTAPPSTPTTPQGASSVLMRAPDNSTQQVPADQVDHYTKLGATPLNASTGAPVQMRAPDGSVKSVSPDQVDHYKSLGATLLGAAA